MLLKRISATTLKKGDEFARSGKGVPAYVVTGIRYRTTWDSGPAMIEARNTTTGAQIAFVRGRKVYKVTR